MAAQRGTPQQRSLERRSISAAIITAYRTARENGRTYRLYANSHCVVVSGYDLNEGLVLVSDSLAGQVSYDLQQFAVRYYELGAQAVVIE